MKILYAFASLLAAYILVCIANASSLPALVDDIPDTVELHAARDISAHQARDQQIRIRNEADFLYGNEHGDGQNPTFFSRVKVLSKKPMLILEELDDQLDAVWCDKNRIYIRFREVESFRNTMEPLANLVGGVVVASHSSCNDKGSRDPHFVHHVAFDNDRTATITILKTSWSRVADNVKIEFAQNRQGDILLQHDRLRRDIGMLISRNNVSPAAEDIAHNALEPSTTSTESSNTSAPTPTSFPPVAFRSPVPPRLPTNNLRPTATTTTTVSSSAGISTRTTSSLPDQSLIPPSTATDLPDAVTIDLSRQIRADYINEGPPATRTMLPSASFRLPGFGRAGLMVRPEMYFDWDFHATAITLDTLGFEVRLPESARVALDFGGGGSSNSSTTNWTTSGFSALDAAMLTLNSGDGGVARLDMTLGLGLRLHLSLAFASDVAGLSAAASVFLDLPALAASGKTIPSANYSAVCNDGRTGDEAEAHFTDLYKSLVHLEADAVMNVGVEMGVEVPFADASFLDVERSAVFYDKMMRTGCFAFDPANMVLINATEKIDQMRQDLADNSKGADGGEDGPGSRKGGGYGNGSAVRSSPSVLFSLAAGGLVLVALTFSFL